jgi:hypothetical protein
LKKEEEMHIKIIACEMDKYIIEPIKSKSPTLYGFSPQSDLSMELSGLKKRLLENKPPLKEGSDYEVYRGPWPNTDYLYQLKFSGKSQVLRGLFAIPVNWIDFNASYFELKSKASPKAYFERKRLVFAMQISSKECGVSEMHIVEEANALLLQDVMREVNKIHQETKIHSPVIEKLNHDLNLISQRKDAIFGDSNFKFFSAALRHARESLPPESELYKKYSELFNGCVDFLGNCRGFTTSFGNAAYAFLERNYYPLISEWKQDDPSYVSSRSF